MTFPQAVLPIVSEMQIDGAWVPITSRIERANGNGIRISNRGRKNEANKVQPATCTFDAKNNDLYFAYTNYNSANYGKLGGNTPFRSKLRWAYDTFTRSASSSWGSTTTGQAWTNTGGSASDYSVNGTDGLHTHTTVNVSRASLIQLPVQTDDVQVIINSAQMATGASLSARVVLGTASDNFYAARLDFTTTGTVQLSITKALAGVASTLISAVTVGTYTAGQDWFVRLKRNNAGFVCALAAPASQVDPGAWTLISTSADRTIPTLTHGGCVSRAETGNTNANPVIKYDDFEVNSYRFWGEVATWSPNSDDTGLRKWVSVDAGDALRRLSKGARPLKSALFRGVSAANPIAYWPMEDGTDVTQLVSAISGVSAMAINGVQPSSATDLIASAPLPVWPVGSFASAPVPAHTMTTQWTCEFMMKVDSQPTGNNNYVTIRTSDATVVRWGIDIEPNTATGEDTVWLRSYLANGTSDGNIGIPIGGASYAQPGVDETTLSDRANFYGHWFYYTIFVYHDDILSTAAGFSIARSGLNSSSALGHSGAIGKPTSIVLATGNTPAAYGHLSINNDPTAYEPISGDSDRFNIATGYAKETGGQRLRRLCAEEDIAFTYIGANSGNADASVPVGPQLRDTLLNNLQAAADAAQGILYASRDFFGLEFRSNDSLLNQTGPTFDYSADHLKEFKPATDDDRYRANRVTARRNYGAFAEYEVTSGKNSSADYPNGIGEYHEDLTWNLYSDNQLYVMAGWRAHLGTWGDTQLANLGVWGERSVFASSATRLGNLCQLDIGAYLAIANPRSDLPPDALETLIQGYTEAMANYEWHVSWNTVPYGPYKAFVVDSTTLGRVDGTHSIRTAVNTSATSWDIATTAGPVMTTADSDDGFQWKVEAELVTVTDVAPSLVTYGSVATASSGSSGSRTPGLPGSAASGNLILILASTRNSGTGVPDTPTDWVRYPCFPTNSNVQLFGRIYDGVWTMPTVTFTGGAANEDTIAQSWRIAGKFNSASFAYLFGASCLNASAQDITYPGIPVTELASDCIIFYLGWKQDDFTSVATIAGATEIQEASSTAGNDASQVADYLIQTTATLVPAGVFTVTGGAAAISRGAVAAFRCDYQTATVTRSVNGVSQSHAAGVPTALYPAPHLAM